MKYIITPRLHLRPHRLDDFEQSAAMWAHPRVVEHITGVPSTREQSWSRLLRYAGHWALLDWGYWVVEERDAGAFVGEVGFADFHRAIEPPLDGIPELGWALAPEHHGKGYATEAVQAAIAWGEAHFSGIPYIACFIGPGNIASVRVAEKCGFTLLQETSYQSHPVLLYKRAMRA